MSPVTLFGATALFFGAIGSAMAQSLPDFTELVERNIPSVVHIQVQRRSAIQATMPDDDTHRGWLDRMPNGLNGESSPVLRAVSGSGFVIDAEGYVLTNHHVIEDAETIVVRLKDRRELDAEIVGVDIDTDVALLRVDGGDLPPVSLGSSVDLKLGEWVVAIGSPFDFEHSVTAGIVSAKGRTFRDQQYVSFLQTDVPINRGNSGGPLLNAAGKVVGINSQIFSGSGGYMGLSFAIPIETASSVARQLREYGDVRRGRLGVEIADVTRAQAETLGLSPPRGALVRRVVGDSSASDAGVQPGDVILEFDGVSLMVSSALPPLVGATEPGTEAKLLIFREGEERTVTATIDRLEETER